MIKSTIKILFILCSLGGSAQTTNIPDPEFEQVLINENIDSDGVVNGQILTADINTVATLTLNNTYISTLSGIEDFTALEEFYFLGNSNNTPIYTIDFSSNTNLKIAEFYSVSHLTNLNFSGCIALETVKLIELSDDFLVMPIEELILNNHPNIKFIETDYLFQFSKIDLKNNQNSQISNLTISLDNSYGPNVCIQVDDGQSANNNNFPYSNWDIYATGTYSYSENCNLRTSNFNKIDVQLFPNPATENFQLKTTEEIKSLTVYSLSGKEVLKFQNQNTYDVSQLPAGIYFVKMETSKGTGIQKLIKN